MYSQICSWVQVLSEVIAEVINQLPLRIVWENPSSIFRRTIFVWFYFSRLLVPIVMVTEGIKKKTM
jgi:CBS domain containing-hemolysin-like protein